MSIRISGSADSQKLQKIKKFFSGLEKETKEMSAEAINNVSKELQEHISNYASKEYYIDKKSVFEATKILWANKRKPWATIMLRGRKFSLRRFHLVSSKTAPLQVGVIRGRSSTIQRAWLMRSSKNAELHVFAVKKDRKDKPSRSKKDIEVLRGVSIPQMIGTERAMKSLNEKLVAEIDKEAERGLNRILGG